MLNNGHLFKSAGPDTSTSVKSPPSESKIHQYIFINN